MATLVAPLGHVEAPEKLSLGGHLSIERTPLRVKRLIAEKLKKNEIRHPADYSHCLVQRRSPCKDAVAGRQVVQRLVILLRLFKAGGVFFNTVFHDKTGSLVSNLPLSRPPSVTAKTIHFFMAWSRQGAELSYALSEEEAVELGAFIKKYRDDGLLKLPPFLYFFRAYHEPYLGDRFLRNAVGLEGALVNDQSDQSNIAFKFKERGASLLHLANPHEDGPDGYVKRLSAIYEARSDLVHGNRGMKSWKSEKAQRLLEDSEEFLRVILRTMLAKPDLATSAGVDTFRRKAFARGIAT
jgi:hypothetical protein